MEDGLNIVDYSRQEQLDEDMEYHDVDHVTNVVIGCGGVGFWLTLLMALHGEEHFILMDGEKIEPTNLNRLPVPQTWVGVNKAIALRRMVRYVRPGTVISVLTSHIHRETLDLLGTIVEDAHRRYRETIIVWDATDDARIQRDINKTVDTLQGTRHNICYRKIGYEGWDIGNYVDYEVWYGEDYEPGYRTSRANAITSAIAAGIGYFSQRLGQKRDVSINIKKLIEKGGNNGKQS